jgi:predicted peptidase
MLPQNSTFETSPPLCTQCQFHVKDRVETYNHCKGTVVRVDIDESGVFIVVRFDTLYGEFVYDPYDLKVIQ